MGEHDALGEIAQLERRQKAPAVAGPPIGTHVRFADYGDAWLRVAGEYSGALPYGELGCGPSVSVVGVGVGLLGLAQVYADHVVGAHLVELVLETMPDHIVGRGRDVQ